ncbi:CBO0543 family protein [Bacillus thermotolerans]|nr:CBO0543 family protein [Bacillus thermotolerans]KKB34761.1 hypothetical protein QY97_02174 [Bacillus thermotolerans]
MLLSSLLGTYLDLLFTGKSMYAFPARPFASIFSVNLLFTLVVLPAATGLFLMLIQRWSWLKRAVFILLLGLGAAVMEKQAEAVGLFVHSEEWSHLYTVAGYSLFLFAMAAFHDWFCEK